MKRMWSKNELKNLANAQIQEQVSGGQLENVKVFEEIIDKDDHKRFIEGDITIAEITGVTKTYGKWSLSGTHLMIVIAGAIANATEIPYTSQFVVLDSIPSWINSKIVPTFSNYVDSKQLLVYNDDSSNQAWSINLRQNDDTKVMFISVGSLTASKDRNYRIVFDMLIDNN